MNLVNDVKRKDHQRYNYLDEANAASTEAERSRAIDFLNACDYAIANFVKLDNVTAKDIAFFTQDYMRRLRGKFDSLPEDLKTELAPLYKL